MKTLGQIAQEAFDAAPHDPSKTYLEQKAAWMEAAAQAVRAAVLEECAKVCETHAMAGWVGRAGFNACAAAIRILK